MMEERVDDVRTSVYNWCSGVLLLGADDHIAESRRFMVLVCSSVGLRRVVGWVGNLLSKALEVCINDKWHS